MSEESKILYSSTMPKLPMTAHLPPVNKTQKKISSMMYMAFNVVIRSRNWSVRGKNSLGVSGL